MPALLNIFVYPGICRMNLKYYPLDLSAGSEVLKTEIKHITKDDKSRFVGHYLVIIDTRVRDLQQSRRLEICKPLKAVASQVPPKGGNY